MCACRHALSDITLQSLTTRLFDQRAPNHFEEMSWKRLPAYHFLAMTICWNTQAQASCLQPRRKGVADGPLPHSKTALQFAEDIK